MGLTHLCAVSALLSPQTGNQHLLSSTELREGYSYKIPGFASLIPTSWIFLYLPKLQGHVKYCFGPLNPQLLAPFPVSVETIYKSLFTALSNSRIFSKATHPCAPSANSQRQTSLQKQGPHPESGQTDRVILEDGGQVPTR